MGQRALSRFAVALSCLFLTPLSWANEAPRRVILQVVVCDETELASAAARQALQAELAADGVSALARETPLGSADGVLTVSVGCDLGLTAAVRLESSRTQRAREENVDLADADPTVRPRALALAVAEFVRLEWAGLTRGATSDPDPAGPALAAAQPPPAAAFAAVPATDTAQKPPAPVVHAARPSTPKPPTRDGSLAKSPELHPAFSERHAPAAWRWGAAAAGRWYVDYGNLSWGVNLGVTRQAWTVHAEFLTSSASDVLGRATLGSSALGVGYRVADSVLGPIRFSAYPQLSAGVTWIQATPRSTAVVVTSKSGFYGDARFVLEVRLREPRLSPVLELELGRATGFAARAAERVVGATGGFYLGSSIGLEY